MKDTMTICLKFVTNDKTFNRYVETDFGDIREALERILSDEKVSDYFTFESVLESQTNYTLAYGSPSCDDVFIIDLVNKIITKK